MLRHRVNNRRTQQVPRTPLLWSLLGSGILCGALIGCGSNAPTGERFPTVSAEGVLLHQGKPLEYHQVTLFPEGERPAAGVSDEQGKFVLGTNEPGDGAVVGLHRVSVRYVGPPNSSGDMAEAPAPPPPKVKIDKKYTSPETSGLTVEISEGGNRELKIELP